MSIESRIYHELNYLFDGNDLCEMAADHIVTILKDEGFEVEHDRLRDIGYDMYIDNNPPKELASDPTISCIKRNNTHRVVERVDDNGCTFTETFKIEDHE